MKRLFALLAVTTATSALGISAALADPDFVASVGAGPLTWSGSGQNIDGNSVRGEVSAEYNFTPELGVQGDVLARFDTVEGGGQTLDITSLDGTLHAFYRDPDKFLFGGLVQLGQDEYDFAGLGSGTINRGLIGVEGQAFFDQVTIYGQAGLQQLTPEDVFGPGVDENFDGSFITGEIRYFLTPDFKIETHAGRGDFTVEGFGESVDFTTLNFGFGAEYKLADMPISIFGRYDYSNFSADEFSGSLDTHRVLVGVKFNMGEETLQDRDRSGASLKPVEIAAFPQFGISPP